MTTYVPESQKGRAIAAFWIIFNLGGGIGSLASFGMNYHSTSGTVSDGTYIALLIIMAIGWLMGALICPPKSVRVSTLETTPEGEKNWLSIAKLTFKTICDWRVLSMLPLFFCANVFYSYQQNTVNGMTFNIRSRSLNGALYWIAQMFGGLIMGFLLDVPGLNRQWRARLNWLFLFVTGMAIWGGGYAFQLWYDRRVAEGKKPVCVEACPLRALDFGDIEELRSEFGDVAAIAPLPDPSETKPNIVITEPKNARPVDDAQGAVLNVGELV